MTNLKITISINNIVLDDLVLWGRNNTQPNRNKFDEQYIVDNLFHSNFGLLGFIFFEKKVAEGYTIQSKYTIISQGTIGAINIHI